MHHPLLPLLKSHAGGWLIHLLWKGVASNSSQCPWLNTPFINLPTSVSPLMEIAMKVHNFKTWFVGVWWEMYSILTTKHIRLWS